MRRWIALPLQALAGLLLALLLQLLRWSWRVRVRGAAPARGSLFACWHGDLIALSAAPLSPRPTVLVSRSRDGTIAAWAARLLGYRIVRGSTSRGAVAGARALVRTLRVGGPIAVAVDGPRGPRELASSSAARIAAMAGAPVVPFAARARPAIQLRSWDRMLIPLPFARVEIVLGGPLEEESRLQGALDGLRARLTRGLAAALALALLLSGCEPGSEQIRRALASQESSVRAEAIERLVESRDLKAVELVLPHLKDPSPRVRRAAVAAVASLGATRAQLGRLIDRLQDGDLEVRLASARALGDSSDSRARPPLVTALEDRSTVVRRAAAAALSTLGLTPEQQTRALAAEHLAAELKRLQHPDDQIRASAARELGLSEQPAATEALIRVLDRATPMVVREAAIALGRIADPRSRAALEARAGARDPADRSAAALGLALQGGARAAGLLAQMLDDASPAVRRGALVAVVERAEPPLPPALRQAVCRQLLDPSSLALDAARVVRARGLRCPTELAVLGEKQGLELDRTLEILGVAHDPTSTAVLLRAARQRYLAHRAAAVAWVAPDRWREVEGGTPDQDPPIDPAPPPKGDKTRGDPGRRPALERLLRRFPQRPTEEQEDPLLPPRISAASVARLIQILGERAGEGSVRDWLVEVAREAPPTLRAAALRALASIAPAPASAPASPPAGSQPSEPGDPSGRAVWAGLKSDRVEVRRAAALGCRLLGEAAPGTAESLLRERDFDLRQAGASCAGELRLARAAPTLLRLLAEERSAQVIRALALLGERRAAAAFAGLLRDEQGSAPGTEERVLIIGALGELADPSVAATLEHELGHPDWRVRLAAVRALRRAPRRASRAALEVCRGDFVAEVRRACAAAWQGLR